jgi:hypothetical protein
LVIRQPSDEVTTRFDIDGARCAANYGIPRMVVMTALLRTAAPIEIAQRGFD